MILKGGLNFVENGLTTSIRAMHLQQEQFAIHNNNVNGFDKIGYQRKDAVVSSFSEWLGVHGLSTAVDDSVGRIVMTQKKLDFALAEKGYFQYQTPEGIKTTRDGRFRLDKEGNLLTNEGYKILSDAGVAIKLPYIPKDLNDIMVNRKGDISIINRKTGEQDFVGTLSVVTNDGVAVLDPNVKQGYLEYSNVALESEFMQIFPIRRNFDANRQMFIIQSTNLASTIEKLGSSS